MGKEFTRKVFSFCWEGSKIRCQRRHHYTFIMASSSSSSSANMSPTDDAELGIVEWDEIKPLLPQRGIRSGVSGDAPNDISFESFKQSYRRNMETEQGKRTTLGIALLIIALILSGSIVVIVNIIKSHPDSHIYGAVSTFNDRIRHPGGEVGGSDTDLDSGHDHIPISTGSPTMITTLAPTITGKPIVVIVDSSVVVSDPGPGPGPDPGPEPKPTPGPTEYDPLSPTRKPSPDPNATKKPSGKVEETDGESVVAITEVIDEPSIDSSPPEEVLEVEEKVLEVEETVIIPEAIMTASILNANDREQKPSPEIINTVKEPQQTEQQQTETISPSDSETTSISESIEPTESTTTSSSEIIAEEPKVAIPASTPVLTPAVVPGPVANDKPSSAAFNHPTARPTAQMDMSASFNLAASGQSLSVMHVSNEYGLYDRSKYKYPFLENSFLIEPYKETTITVQGTIQSCTYDYTITNVKKSTSNVRHSGTVEAIGSFTISLTDVGQYKMTITEHCGSNTFGSSSNLFWVKYVRRELSTLTVEDREDFLDAFHTLWKVSTLEGQKLYGEKYKSIYWLATLHNDGGGNAACDEFHGDVGFLSNHVYLSAYLEQSLQLVNPRVALHYMEYSKYFESLDYAGHLTNQLSGGGWTDILTSTFFGRNDPISGRIMDGRWANSPVPRVTPEFLVQQAIPTDKTFFPDDEHLWLRSTSSYHISSPYGLLRSPWNYNPANYTVRYDNVFRIEDVALMDDSDVSFKYHMGVKCIDYQIFFDKVRGQPLKNYLTSVEDDTHGIIHFTFGGVGGNRVYSTVHQLINTYGFSYSNVAAMAVSAQPFFKLYLAQNPTIYAMSGRTFPLNCTGLPWDKVENRLKSTIAPGEVGGPQCDFNSYYYQSEMAVNELVQTFFRVDPSTQDPVRARLYNLPWETRMEVMKLIANMFPYDGDLAGSGAPLDPLFWVAHGAVERLYQKSIFSNIFSDMTYERAFDFPCSGHDKDATKAWLEGYEFIDKTVQSNTLTNEQLTMILNPTSDEYRDLVSYLYDTDRFDWCPGAEETWFTTPTPKTELPTETTEHQR